MDKFANPVVITPEQQSALDSFREYLEGDGKSPRTVESYLADVIKFIRHIGPTEIGEIKRADVTTFFAGLVRSGKKPSTVNKAVNSMACFCRHLREKGQLPEGQTVVVPRKDRVKVADGSQGEVAVLSEKEINALLALASDRDKTSVRNQLIIHLLLYAGLRVSELVTLRLADLDLAAGLVVIHGKGNKLREIPLKSETLKLLKEYQRGQRAASKFLDSEFLLISQRAPKLHRDAINTLLERMGNELGFPIRPHQLRHTFCTLLVQRGVPLTTVAKLAGHASIQTTSAFYINSSREEKLNAVNLL